MTISERIKTEAIKQNTTLAALERAAGLGNGTIRRWDTNSPSVDKLAKIANLLSMSLDFLYTGHPGFASNFNESTDEEASNKTERRLLSAFRELPIDDQDEVLGIIELKLSRAKLKGVTTSEILNITKDA